MAAASALAQRLKLSEHVRQRALVNRMSATAVPGTTRLDTGPANFLAFLAREFGISSLLRVVKRRLALLYDPAGLVSETCGLLSGCHRLCGPANFHLRWAQAWRISVPLCMSLSLGPANFRDRFFAGQGLANFNVARA